MEGFLYANLVIDGGLDVEMIDINGKTRTCGLIGNPVEHTMSPLIHNFLAEELGQNMVYVPFHVEKGSLENAINGAYALNVMGMNVTVPYKNEVIEYLSEVDFRAQKIGAVNTLVRTEKGYNGYNTDFYGLMRAMRSDNVSIKDEEIIILGAGGVGRAVAFMCVLGEAKKVYLLNRSLDKAEAVAAEVNNSFDKECVFPMTLDGYKGLLGGDKKYFVIQSTSVGLYPDSDKVVLDDAEFYKNVKIGYDLIYTPWETKFMKLVSQYGGKSYNGLKMLLYQAIGAFELWNGCKVSYEVENKVYEKLKDAVKK